MERESVLLLTKKYIREVNDMAVKFAKDIAKEIRERGSIEVPEVYFTVEAFENWLCSEARVLFDDAESSNLIRKDAIMPLPGELSYFSENYGEAA